MDRFKFRAYIEKYNKLVEVYNFGNDMGVCQWVLHSSIYDTPDGKPVLDDWGSVDERFSNIVNRTKLIYCVLEQCIGQKDKNDKLIYEGDIVKDINGHYGYVKWDSQELKYFVCKRLGVVPYLTPCSIVRSYEYEVVGNIHENKDLLEDK